MRWCRRSVYLRSGKNRCSARYSTAYSSLSVRKPRPDCSGRGDVAGGRSVAVVLAAAGPDQAEGLAAFVIEEVGVDRRGEARIVELDREVIAALVGALRPRGADLCAADKDPVAWRVVAGPVGLRNDADPFGLHAEGDDLALELVAGLLEGTDGCHVVSPWLFEPATIAASMAIDRPQAIDAAPLGAGATRRMAAAGLSWLARNGRSPGEESLTAAIAVRRSRLAVLWPDHAIKRPRGPRARQPCKEKTWRTWVRARGQASRAKEQKPWRTERRPSGTSASARFQTPKSISCGYRSRFDRSAAMAALLTVGF